MAEPSISADPEAPRARWELIILGGLMVVAVLALVTMTIFLHLNYRAEAKLVRV